METNYSLLINVLLFSHPVKELECSLYTEKKEGYWPIHKGDLKGIIEDYIPENELEQLDWLYTDFKSPVEDALTLTVNFEENPYFANHYYRHLICTYFKGKADVVSFNFTNDIEVWFKTATQTNIKFTTYNQFTLKLQFQRLSEGPELVVSFDGTTKVLNKSLKDLVNFPTENLNWINCDGELHRYKYMPPHFKQDLSKLFPVVSNKLKPAFDILFDKPTFYNRYPKYKKLLEEFYQTHLDTEAFHEVIPITADGFINVNHDKIQRISNHSNKLLFGNNREGEEPKFDLIKYGPYKPSPHNNVHFFFIYHKPDKTFAVKQLYEYFIKGFNQVNENQEIIRQIFPNLQDYIKQPFHIEALDSIAFDTIESAVETVDKAIRNRKTLQDVVYMAIYVSPVSKLDKDPAQLDIYFRIKEILLQHSISSQVVYKQHILSKSFNYFLPNIETAILAKLGGIPWRLNRSLTSELIVGIGAFYSITRKSKYLASAFCFNNEGIFENFDCFLSNDTDALAGSIRKAVLKFLVDHEKADRLIIHFYKVISKKELKPIMETLYLLGLQIPVFIVTINKTESKSLLAFDTSYKELMPLSGTIVQVGKRDYLLFNNIRYKEDSILKEKEYPFPIKISFASSKPELLDDPKLINELTDQVYQFSRMYWKSVSQQSLPVTICYPEMVAEIFPHFKSETMPPYGRSNLWFL